MECEAESKPQSVQAYPCLSAKSDLSIKICSEGTELPLWCTVNQLSRTTILHCKFINDCITIPT